MDSGLRNALYTAVVRCRAVLEKDLSRLLEGYYGVHADGTVEDESKLVHLDAPGRLDREAIEAALAHFRRSGLTEREAVERYLRESAFTWLNRLAALKLMEQPGRGVIQPSVGAGPYSSGFRQFALLSEEAIRGEVDGGYRLYLELLCEDLALALGALFDLSLPTSALFPSETGLTQVLALINDRELEPAWSEDETIGWVYQYFTPTELRREARKAPAPRTGHELAFLNQFYTPRYVVAFLADNSLGRLWWHMRRGDTALAEVCSYLITREGPESAGETLPKKDPRELRVLDPACGSGHFLLYCFHLLEVIYAEAYDDPDLGPGLQSGFPDREGYLHQVPALILEHNLFGIDIDLRAVQIAGLALWLRAHNAWAQRGLRLRERPRGGRAHIVQAAPMPGEYELLGDFVRELQPRALGNLLLDLWDKMKLAGEAGSLLKVEQETADAIRRTRENLASQAQYRLPVPGGDEADPLLDPTEWGDEEFWQEAEPRLMDALGRYARRWGADRPFTRRLFALDALAGVSFMDLMRHRYDVVLMNPPFGAASVKGKEYIARAYPRTKNDLYAAFVERGLELLRPGGYLGAITSRTGFFLTSFRKWREEILMGEADLVALADLGYGVLDTAMVETAAYVLRKRPEATP